MLSLKILTLLLALTLAHLTSANPAARPEWHKRQHTNSTTTSLAGTGTAHGTGTGAVQTAHGTGTGAMIHARATAKPAFEKRQFTNSTTAAGTTAAGIGAVWATGTGTVSAAGGAGTGMAHLFV